MDFCRTLRTLGAALLVGLGFFSGALAQSGNPIRIGMSLALTGAGASPSKVVNTALDLWRDDINARGGLLGRPVELVIYDDQSAPANVPIIYTKLITVDKVDLLLAPTAPTSSRQRCRPSCRTTSSRSASPQSASTINSTTRDTSRWCRRVRRAWMRSQLASLTWQRRSSRNRRR